MKRNHIILTHNGDRYGWVKGIGGKWHFTLFIQSGRIADFDDYKLMTGLREIAKIHTGDFRLTGNQNVIIANVSSQKKKKINELIEQYGLTDGQHYSALTPQLNGVYISSNMWFGNGGSRTLFANVN